MSMVKNAYYDVDHEEDWDLEALENPVYSSTSLSRLAIEMYGAPKQIEVLTWDDCNTARYALARAYQESTIDSNALLNEMLNLEFWIKKEQTLATTFIHTIAVKLEAAYKNHSILKNKKPGEDELQEILIAIIEALKTENPQEATITQWIILRIDSRISNLLRNELRALRRGLGEVNFEMLDIDNLHGDDAIDNRTPTPEEEYEIQEMKRLLNQLSPRQKEVMEMLVDGLSYEEIAEELNITVDTVHSHIDRARIKLAPSRADYYKE